MSESELLPSESPVLSPVANPPLASPSGGLMLGPSWQDQDPVLRDMWMKNTTPQAIAEALNRSVPAIMTRAARLGLPRRSAPGRKPGRRALDDKGVPLSSAVMRRMAPPQPAVAATPTTSPRTCLMCLTSFQSAGRHNRICPSCKGSSEYESASALPELHVPA